MSNLTSGIGQKLSFNKSKLLVNTINSIDINIKKGSRFRKLGTWNLFNRCGAYFVIENNPFGIYINNRVLQDATLAKIVVINSNF